MLLPAIHTQSLLPFCNISVGVFPLNVDTIMATLLGSRRQYSGVFWYTEDSQDIGGLKASSCWHLFIYLLIYLLIFAFPAPVVEASHRSLHSSSLIWVTEIRSSLPKITLPTTFLYLNFSLISEVRDGEARKPSPMALSLLGMAGSMSWKRQLLSGHLLRIVLSKSVFVPFFYL